MYMISELSPLIHLMFCIISNTLGSGMKLLKNKEWDIKYLAGGGMRLLEAVVRRYFVKKLFLKIS